MFLEGIIQVREDGAHRILQVMNDHGRHLILESMQFRVLDVLLQECLVLLSKGQEIVDPHIQLLAVDRLRQELVCAHLEPEHERGRVVESRDQDDGQVLVAHPIL